MSCSHPSRTRLLFVFAFLLPVLSATAQSGWDLIRANDNRAARAAFKTALDKDSMDDQSIKGMIYLSEIEQDNLGFRKYVSRLLNKSDDEALFLVFEDYYSDDPAKIVKKAGLTEKARMASRVAQADDLERHRKFEDAKKARRDLFLQLPWSFIGPFKNLSGSGHIVEYPIEKEPFDATKTYNNPNGITMRWVQPKSLPDDGKLDPEDYTMRWSERSVYYANTFFDAAQAGKAQLRIGRETPMKIWLDDKLVFNADNETNFSWDNEIVTLDLPAGTHRLLVKLSSAGSPPKSYRFLEFNPGGGYTNGDGYDYSGMFDFAGMFGGGGDEYGGGGDNAFCIRITDTNGALMKISPAAGTGYTPGNFSPEQTAMPAISILRDRVNKDPNDLFNWYALCRAALDAKQSQQVEELFVKALRKQPNLVLLKFLTARIYARNGKVEKTYEMLNEIDANKTPVFGDMYQKFQDIDLASDPDRYLESLNKLNSVTPTNYSVIRGFVSYYNARGLRDEKEAYIKKMMADVPDYKESLQWELEHDDNKPYKEQTDKEQEKDEMEAVRNIKSRFVVYDYTSAIQHYKEKANSKKVLALYDELISILPYRTYYKKDKAEYLYSEERYDEALATLQDVLAINPYTTDAIEQIGDIWYDKGKTNNDDLQKALGYYKQAKQLGSTSYSLDEKIEKIEGQKTYKKLFTTETFDDVLANPEWKRMYQEEESVILLYTRDLIMNERSEVEVYQQFMVKILNDNGAKKWTEYNFSFLGNLTSVKVKKANGTEFTPDQRGGYVVIKNLSPGDIIMLEGLYKWTQYDEQLDTEFTMTHYVAFDVPIWHKKFEIAIPQGRYLGQMTHLVPNNVQKSTHDQFDFYRWQYTGLPKAENEDAILDSYDPYGTIMVSTMPDWSKVVNWYQQKTYRRLEMTYDIREALDSIIHPGMNDQAKVDAVYNYLTRDIKYSYVSFLQSGYVPKSPALTLSARIGDCKDVATLMMTMLKGLNIECYFALVKTNSFNHQDMLPSLSFDHVIVCAVINGEKRYYDMTTDFYPSYVLTENDLGAYALLIKDGEKSLFRLPDDDLDPNKNKVNYDIAAQLNADRTLNLNVNATMPGIAGGSMRETFAAGISELERRNYLTSMLGGNNYQNLSLVDYKLQNITDIDAPLKSDYTLKAEEYSDEVVGLLICGIPWMNSLQSSPAISSKTRSNSLDLSQICGIEPMTQKVTLKFPKGYKLMRVPQNVTIDNKYGHYEVKFKQQADGSLYVEKYQQFKIKTVPPEEFDAFKAFYLQLLKQDRIKIAVQQM